MLDFKPDTFPSKDHYLKCSFRTERPCWGILFWKGASVGKKVFFVVAHTDLVIWVVPHFSWPSTGLPAWWLHFSDKDGLPLTEHMGDSMAGAGARRGPYRKAEEGFGGFLIAPATLSEVSGLAQNSPVVLFLLLTKEKEWLSGWGGFLQVQRYQLEPHLDFML